MNGYTSCIPSGPPASGRTTELKILGDVPFGVVTCIARISHSSRNGGLRFRGRRGGIVKNCLVDTLLNTSRNTVESLSLLRYYLEKLCPNALTSSNID